MPHEEPIWAVCLYIEGGERDGESFIEFVRAADRGEAVEQTININQTYNIEGFQVTAAALMPEGL